MSPEHVIKWVDQFDESDRRFILTELEYLLSKGIYVSKEQAKKYLFEFIERTTKYYNYQSIETFLRDSQFIRTQEEGKSQDVLLKLLEEVLNEKFDISLEICGSLGAKNYIFIDDILATGGTFLRNLNNWLNSEDHLTSYIDKKINIFCYFFCIHTWGEGNVRYSLKMKNKNDVFLNINQFPIKYHYMIDNNLRAYSPKLNLLYPVKSSPSDIYLANLTEANRYEDRAYRRENQPNKEFFFSSKENRLKLERIFLEKGIEIIGRITDESKRKNHRPLGKTYSDYRTFGTGTMFFTWRNISNTCPIVLWWNYNNWHGLFPLYNRGNEKKYYL